MAEANYDANLRRLKFIEACAYYITIRNIPVKELRLTSDLAGMIAHKLNQATIYKDIGLFKFSKYLSEYMIEKLPDIDEDIEIEKSVVQFYNFRSMVTKLADKLTKMVSTEPMDVIDNGLPLPLSPQYSTASPTPSSTPSSTAPSSTAPSSTAPSDPPRYVEIDTRSCDFLKGFSVQLKADPHLDESIPISARDQHLLYNIFGDKWNNPTIVEAYIVVKGKTGYMSSWSPKDAKKLNDHHSNAYGLKH